MAVLIWQIRSICIHLMSAKDNKSDDKSTDSKKSAAAGSGGSGGSDGDAVSVSSASIYPFGG